MENVALNVSRVAVYIHKDVFKKKLRTDLMTDEFSSIWLEIGLKGQRSILVGHVYRDWQYLFQADNSSLSVQAQLLRFSGFIDKWESAIESSEECHLVGDLNLNFLEYSKGNLLPNSQSYKLRSLINLLYERIMPLGAIQCVTSATRVSANHVASCLDHYYTTNPQKLSQVSVISNGSSDHKIILATRYSKIFQVSERLTKKRSYKNFDQEAFRSSVRKIPWWDIYSCEDVNLAVKLLSDHLIKILDEMAPVRSFQTRTNYAPWLSAASKNWIKMRNDAHDKAVETRDNADWVAYKKLRNKVNYKIKIEKEEWRHHKLKEASKNSGKMWKSVKSFLGWSTGGPPTRLSINGNLIYKPIDIAQEMNNYFANKISNIAGNLPNCHVDALTLTRKIMKNRTSKLSFHAVHPDVVMDIISKMKNSRTCGIDTIDTSIVKLVKAELTPAITHILNLSIRQNIFPNAWKIAKVVPLHKKNEKTDPKNYRPVALLSVLSKILEKAVFLQIMDYMENNKLLHPSHHGFRAGRSTVTALIEMHDIWLEALDRKEISAMVMLDLSAAFDVVNHDILLRKLSVYGFESSAVSWVGSYLSGRQQCVYVDGILSSPVNVEIGVPQGSILGPLLYTIFTNDLPEVVHQQHAIVNNETSNFYNLYCYNCGGICAFADDSTFSISRNDPLELEEAIKEKYHDIADYMAANRLSLNPDKTHLMIMASSRQHRQNEDYDIVLDTGSSIISPSVSERLLGICVTNNFTWNDHVMEMVRGLSLKVSGLQKVCKFVDFKTRKMLANGLINSQLIYCIQLYGSATDYLIRFLQVQQNKAARIVTRLDIRTGTAELLKQVGWLSVRQMYIYHSILLVFKVQQQQRPEYLCDKFRRDFPYETRRSKNNFFSVSKLPKTEASKKGFSYNSLILWNTLPLEIKNATGLEQFKTQLKDWIMKSYPQ